MTLDAEAIKRVAELEFVAKSAVDGFLSGRHRSRFRGASLEFAQHREYVPGDDLRHLDWKVWARGDRLTVKQYEAETNLAAHFLIDASASMDYGVGAENKYTCACSIAAALAYLLVGQSDAVSATIVGESSASELSPRTGRAQFHALTAALSAATPTGESDLAAKLADWASRVGVRGLRIIVSDLYGDAERIAASAAAMRRRGHDVVAFQVLHRDELELPFERFTRFEGMEGALHATCNPTALRDAYRGLIDEHCGQLQRRFRAMGADCRLVRSDQPLGETLASFLLERMRS
jgi:uncharacterized protein (DUF58 family)